MDAQTRRRFELIEERLAKIEKAQVKVTDIDISAHVPAIGNLVSPETGVDVIPEDEYRVKKHTKKSKGD